VLSVAVVGGGIGGLAAALSLYRVGLDVDVYEQAGSVSEVGAGIQVSPNATRVLHGLGLGDDLAAMGVPALAVHQRRWDDGHTLVRTPLADAAVDAFGFAWYQVHRADLLTSLLRALPPERVHVAHRLVGLVERGDAIEADFENGKSVLADVLVGADGIHSTVQRILFGPRDAHFTGCAAYRGLIPAERLSHVHLEVTCDVWLGPGRHFVHYFVRNRELFNFVTAVEQDSWTGESWTDKTDVATALAEFDGWHPQVRAIINAVDEIFIWALFDRLLAPHVCRHCPPPTRRASTSPTDPNNRNATHKWRPDQRTSRRPRPPGSSDTTPPSSNRRHRGDPFSSHEDSEIAATTLAAARAEGADPSVRRRSLLGGLCVHRVGGHPDCSLRSGRRWRA